ncbi:MAG TPA: M23 family metallopeptidase [Candidatus Limnocylindria bacterium]|nr:M23 family metallopeptidase [Candidatus Limnocylindria bacterium]
MPDPQRPLRRLNHARPLTRAVTHVAVIGLVAFASAFGIAAARSQETGRIDTDAAALLPFDLVARARGAAAGEVAARSTSFELRADPNRPDPMLQRRIISVDPTPLPTPVAPPAPAPDPPVVAAAPPAPPPNIVGSGVLLWPVPGGEISQYFSSYHMALDIAAPYGSNVLAADDGVVTWAGWRNNGGGMVIAIDHGNGIVTVYNHLGTIAVGPNQAVAKGQVIGGVGCTGICTGPHVHFETIVGGVLVNPLRYL